MPKAGEIGGVGGVDGMLDTDVDDAAPRETLARAQAGEWSIEDHFSLGIPSSSFRYRSTNLRVIKVGATQLILQQRKDGLPMLAKKASGATFGERFLKIVYVVVAFLLTGFIFVCSLAVILFLFLNILVNFGASSSVPSTLSFGLLGLLSLPVFLQALSTGVSLCFGLVQDIWDDFEYLHLLGKVDTVAAEWLVFIIFAMAPSLTAAICLFNGDEDWWRITGLVWFFGMLFFYALYAISITWYEFWESLSLVRALETGPKDKKSSYSKLFFEAILIRQRFRLNATRRRMFLESETTTRAEPQYESLKLGFLSRISCMYKKLNRPRPLYSISESLEAVPFYTASNWSLHQIFCSPLDNRKAVVLMSGQGSLSNAQLRSSFLCTVITFVLMWTILVGTLLYFEAPYGVIVMATIVTALLCLPRIWVELLGVVRRSPWCKSRFSRPLAQRRAKAAASSRNAASEEDVSTRGGEDVNLDVNLDVGSDGNRSKKDDSSTAHIEESKPSEAFEANLTKLEAAEAVPNSPNTQGEDDEDEVLYRWWITEVVAEAKEWMCYALLVFEVVFLFLLPCVGIFAAGNLPLGLLFIVLGVSTALRHYFNARVFVMVRRSFSDSPIDDLEIEHTTAVHSSDKAQKWRNHTRLHLILTRMNRHESKQRWVLIFGFIVMFTAVLFTASLMSEETSEQTTKYVKFAKDFSIPETVDTLAYPTCSLSSGVPPAISGFKGSLVDFSMLANVAYLDPVSDQAALDDWFGPGATTIQDEITANFKADFAARSPAQYKLITFNNITFPELSKTAVVSIRGTVTTLDMFADMQLWMGASIFQVMRFLLPAGGAWTPILPDLIHYLGALEASNLDEVAYYKETTAFVNAIAADGRWPHIAVTGHSLGGGLAMVTGAQTGFPAIAMSGVNLVLSRKSFDPPLELDAINELTFNVVPDRDPIPRVDDLARMYQRISCRAPVNNIVDCHSSLRIACELQYTCGTNGRPVICACHRDYGYPAPEGNLTEFQQLCGIEEDAAEDVTND